MRQVIREEVQVSVVVGRVVTRSKVEVLTTITERDLFDRTEGIARSEMIIHLFQAIHLRVRGLLQSVTCWSGDRSGGGTASKHDIDVFSPVHMGAVSELDTNHIINDIVT